MTEIDNLLARPKAYYNIDGVGELGMGFMLLAYTLLHWLQMNTPKNSAWHQMPVFFAYVLAMGAVIHYGSKAIKSRITYPRTGFVQYPRRNTFWAMAMAAFVASASVALILVLRPHGWAILEWIFGPLLAGAYAYGVARVWSARWKWIVVSAMVLGSLAIARFPAAALGPYWNTAAVYGALLMISGAVTLILYLRRSRVAR